MYTPACCPLPYILSSIHRIHLSNNTNAASIKGQDAIPLSTRWLRCGRSPCRPSMCCTNLFGPRDATCHRIVPEKSRVEYFGQAGWGKYTMPGHASYSSTYMRLVGKFREHHV